MNERGKSDSPVVPTKPPNTTKAAEVVEERGLAEGNAADPTRAGRRAGASAPSGLDRVREVARKEKDAKFTALLHHVDLDRLRAAYSALNPKATTGVDGVTWDSYGQDLERNLLNLHARVHGGRYQAKPSRRAYIPKTDGRVAAARHRCLGGQDPPEGSGPGAERHLRGGFPGLLLRVPAKVQPARRAGCAGGWDLQEEGELGA